MRKGKLQSLVLIGAVLLSGCTEQPESLVVDMFSVSGTGETVGKIYIHANDEGGIRLQPALHDLPPGELTLQVHEQPSCASGEQDGEPVAASATDDQPGDKSALPLLIVDSYGVADSPIETRRFNLNDLRGRSLIVHTNDPTLTDSARIACGTVVGEQ